MNEANKFADEEAEWERMIQVHAEKLGLDINSGRLQSQARSTSVRLPLSILRYEALKKNKRLINSYRKRGYSLRFIFDMLVSNGKIDYGYVTFWRYINKLDTNSPKQNSVANEVTDNIKDSALNASSDISDISLSENVVSEVSITKAGSSDKQYPDNYVGFKFDPNPDKENLI